MINDLILIMFEATVYVGKVIECRSLNGSNLENHNFIEIIFNGCVKTVIVY